MEYVAGVSGEAVILVRYSHDLSLKSSIIEYFCNNISILLQNKWALIQIRNMNEKLIVKNFGPIREAELDLKKLTVFIGPQGSGKSTLAKLVAHQITNHK